MKKIFLFLVLSFALLDAYNQAGNFDLSFANKGWANTDFIKGIFIMNLTEPRCCKRVETILWFFR